MSLSAAMAMALLVPAPPPRTGSFLEAGATLDLRRGVQLAESLDLRAGVLRPSGLRPGGGLTLSPPRELDALGTGSSMRSVCAYGGAWWQAEGGWAPGLGVTAGVAILSFEGASDPLVWMPRLGAESSLAIPLMERVELVARVHVAADLRQVRLFVDEVPVAELSPWALQAGLSLRLGP